MAILDLFRMMSFDPMTIIDMHLWYMYNVWISIMILFAKIALKY